MKHIIGSHMALYINDIHVLYGHLYLVRSSVLGFSYFISPDYLVVHCTFNQGSVLSPVVELYLFLHVNSFCIGFRVILSGVNKVSIFIFLIVCDFDNTILQLLCLAV